MRGGEVAAFEVVDAYGVAIERGTGSVQQYDGGLAFILYGAHHGRHTGEIIPGGGNPHDDALHIALAQCLKVFVFPLGAAVGIEYDQIIAALLGAQGNASGNFGIVKIAQVGHHQRNAAHALPADVAEFTRSLYDLPARAV